MVDEKSKNLDPADKKRISYLIRKPAIGGFVIDRIECHAITEMEGEGNEEKKFDEKNTSFHRRSRSNRFCCRCNNIVEYG
jgi:hypothetical protein